MGSASAPPDVPSNFSVVIDPVDITVNITMHGRDCEGRCNKQWVSVQYTLNDFMFSLKLLSFS